MEEIRAVVMQFWSCRCENAEFVSSKPPDDAEIQHVQSIAECYAITRNAAFSDPGIWKEWLVDTGRDCGSYRCAVFLGDWLSLERYLPHFLVRLIRTLKRASQHAEETGDAALSAKVIELIGYVLLIKQLHYYIAEARQNGVTREALVESVARRLTTSSSRFPDYLELIKLPLEDFLAPNSEIGVLTLRRPVVAPLLRDIQCVNSDALTTVE
jgi:hypothetical protein